MRKCIRCGAEMKEGCTIKVEGGGYGIVMSTDKNALLEGVLESHTLQLVLTVEKFPCM